MTGCPASSKQSSYLFNEMVSGIKHDTFSNSDNSVVLGKHGA